MNKFLRVRLSVWFALALTVMVGVTIVVINTFERLDAQGKWVLHSRGVVNLINDIRIAADDINSSERDYVITGQLSTLDDYFSAIATISQKTDDLVKLVEDNPTQHQRAEQLRTAVSEKVRIAKQIVTAREKNGFPETLSSIMKGNKEEEAVDDQVRALAAQMRTEEDRLIEVRRAVSLNTRSDALWISSSGMLLGLLIITLVFAAVRRENRRRSTAEREVVLINERLAVSLHQAEQLMNEKNLIDELDGLLHSCSTIEEASEVISKEMPRMLSGLPGAIYLYRSSRNHLEMAASWNTPSALTQETSFAPEDCWALKRGALHLMRNSHTDIACAHISAATVESSICAPMIVHGEMIGLLYIEAKRSQIDKSMTDFSHRIAEQIGMSLATLQLQQSLRSQSLKDALTGLFNRRYLEAAVEKEISRAKRAGKSLGFIMMDIDHFKKMNDTLGHEAGDRVLQEVGSLLRAQTRGEDIVCRYGGEEFLLLLPGTTLSGTKNRADVLRLAVEKMIVIQSNRTISQNITMSFGIALYPDHGSQWEEVARAADRALYRAKESGRNCVMIADKTVPSIHLVS